MTGSSPAVLVSISFGINMHKFIASVTEDFTIASSSGFPSALIKSLLCCSLSGGQSLAGVRKASISL